MAALCPGVQYGLSSQGNFGENKDLIFVKLTDSAYRAIEEYFRNQNKFNQSPTIQFLGNEGQLSFPSEHGSNGLASFNFSMSSTADMEGPGGSFECVAQQSGGALAGLGALPHKLRIHANDDVYEATRHRMTVAEENHKNKCTRVIKPNQTDIGRKVKVKQAPGRSIPPPRPKPAATPPPPTHTPTVVKPSSLISSSNGLGSNHVTSSRPQNNKPSSRDRDSDIMRRPIKERLIHLLALRPLKKPELVERINRDGREKNVFTTVLKQIAYMRDNVYHLHQHIWNDVHDDWPYYTEQERQLLKRRKPQNLTPPGSSDGGSSGSGQSPTSTHPGSPPPPVTSSVKRPGYYDGADGLPTKKPRISHYRKPEPRPAENPQRRPITDSRDASNMNPRSREPPYLPQPGDKRQYSDDEADPITAIAPAPVPVPVPVLASANNRKRACDSHSLSYNVSREKTFKENSICSSPIKAAALDEPRESRTPSKEPLKERERDRGERIERERERDRGERERERDRDRDRERDKERTRWNKVSSTTHNGSSVTRVSPDSQADRILPADSGPPPKIESKSEFPDYLTEYTTIKNAEQRRRYKADFNADYAEYRDLHAVVERVSRRFAQLEERLKQEEDTSQAFMDIRKQIVRDYKENQRDVEYQKAKRRFQYLHDKLSHIKRLVLEYDAGSQAPRY